MDTARLNEPAIDRLERRANGGNNGATRTTMYDHRYLDREAERLVRTLAEDGTFSDMEWGVQITLNRFTGKQDVQLVVTWRDADGTANFGSEVI